MQHDYVNIDIQLATYFPAMFELGGGIGIRAEILSDTSLDCRTETPPMLEVRDRQRLDVVQQLHGRMQYPRKSACG